MLVKTTRAMPLMAPRRAPTMALLVPLLVYLRSAPARRLRPLQAQPRGVPAPGHRAGLCRRDRAGFADQ